MRSSKERTAPRVLLIVIEGWGVRREADGNAIALAHKPNFDRLWKGCPHTTLAASGLEVGLPAGLKGNAETGYQTIGAGRIVPSENMRLDSLIDHGSFFEHPALEAALDAAKQSGERLHLLGLVSDGNVHSRDTHWLALLEAAKRRGYRGDQVLVHAILDGRDSGPRSGLTHVARLMAELVALEVGNIATMVGRKYAMDRDGNTESTEQAARLLTANQGLLAASPIDAVRKGYRSGETDETLSPTSILCATGLPPAPLAEGETVICFNLGTNRTAQLQERIAASLPNLHWHWLSAPIGTPGSVLFPQPAIVDSMVSALAASGRSISVIGPASRREQLTTRFGAGTFVSLVPTSDSNALVSQVECSQVADLTVCVLTAVEAAGHTAAMTTAVRAVETTDEALGRLLRWAEEKDADVILISTHGNAEQLVNPDTGGPYPSHTTNPVPFILVCRHEAMPVLRDDGTLADAGPTILARLGVPIPAAMEGVDLRRPTANRKRRAHPRYPNVNPAALAAIEAGLREEVDSARFYLLAAATAREAASKELCLKLAHDEEVHLAKLRDRYEQLTGVPLELPPSPAVAQAVPDIFDLTVIEILDAAIEGEAETYRMFMSLARKAGDAQAAAILRELGEEEKEHVEELRRVKAEAERWGKFYKVPEKLH